MVKTTPHRDLGDSEMAEPLFPLGATLGGRYVLQEELGRGGMGSVFRVFDRLLEQQVALKFPVRARGQARQYKDAMRREVVLARRVTHPAVARVYDLGEQDDLVFLTMELVRGVTLQRRLRRSPSPLDETLRIAQQVSCGLLTAHEAGVLHLDLKPGNLICAEGDIDRVKIVDFGIANVVGSRANGGGTFDYMAPEQLGDGTLTGAADVYALGLLLHRMLSGQRAFDGDTPEARAMRRLERPPRPLPKSTPPALVDLVRQLLEREPAARPLMRDVAERLTKLAAAGASASASAPRDPLVSRGPQLTPARYRALLRIRPKILEPSAFQHHLSLLADVEAHTPDLPLTTAIRAAVLVRRWTMTPDQEGLDLVDAAQDALQRALAKAPLLPETHLADALISDAMGDVGGTLQGLYRALARDPAHGPSRAILARLELEAGLSAEENLAVLEDIGSIPPWLTILQLRAHLFSGRYDDLTAGYARLEQGSALGIAEALLEARRSLYLRASTDAVALLPALGELARTNPFAEVLVHIVERVAGRSGQQESDDLLRRLLERKTSPKRHCFFLQIFCELAATEAPETALTLLWRAAHLPLTDLQWLDACPALAPLRHKPAFRHCRETVVTRLRPLLVGDDPPDAAHRVTVDDAATLPLAAAGDTTVGRGPRRAT